MNQQIAVAYNYTIRKKKEKMMLTFASYLTNAQLVMQLPPDPFKPCRKKPIVVHAAQINEEFRVDSLEGDYAQGKPGDYLIVGINNEQYICDKAIFEKSYDWVEEVPPSQRTPGLHPK